MWAVSMKTNLVAVLVGLAAAAAWRVAAGIDRGLYINYDHFSVPLT